MIAPNTLVSKMKWSSMPMFIIKIGKIGPMMWNRKESTRLHPRSPSDSFMVGKSMVPQFLGSVHLRENLFDPIQIELAIIFLAIILGVLITWGIDWIYSGKKSRKRGSLGFLHFTSKWAIHKTDALDKVERHHQECFIATYEFPPTLSKKIHSTYPHIASQDIPLVLTGLRDFFLLCHIGEMDTLSLPSQIVDVAWHEFILSTRIYEEFCQQAYGHFLHHTPAESMQGTEYASEGIKRTWALACKREDINPKTPDKLPLLFSLDANLGISDGYQYSLDCSTPGSYPYCATHIGEPWFSSRVVSPTKVDSDSLYQVTAREGRWGGGGCGGGGCGGGGCGGD